MSFTNNLRCILPKISFYRDAYQSSFYLTRKCSTNMSLQYDKDPGPEFLNPEVQKLLKSITRIQLDKVFKKRMVADNSVEYKFMTTEQLEKEFKKLAIRAEEFIQMPPVVMVKSKKHRIISKDPALLNFSDTKYVIADITYGINRSKRKVIVRHTDGTLEHAPDDVTKRVIQTYFPLEGRKIQMPKMFEGEHFKRCLDEHKYEFILDRLCIQFEPFDKEYHDISTKVYNHINEQKKFDDLRSTRHFGPMAFYFAWHKLIDDLLYDIIQRDFLRNGAELVILMYHLNNINYDKSIQVKLDEMPQTNNILDVLKKSINTSDDIHEEIKSAIGKSREDFESDDICLEVIEDYIKNNAIKKVQLELAVQTFKETNDEKRKLYEGLRKAHGVN